MSIQDVMEMFVPNKIGRLMKMDPSEQTRFQFEVWFEYTRQTMTQLREGTLLAVRNFATHQSETHYTILEIASILPIHYALGGSTEGYPGFVMEAARNIATDWTTQEEHSQEDTTIIRCIALPTGHELAESHEGRDLDTEQALPMIGSDVRVFTSEATREIVNREISPEQPLVFESGKWLVDREIPIYIRAEDFVRVHFGIFGFTGAGKSNIVSTYVANLLQSLQEEQTPEEQQQALQQPQRPVKIVLFDLMSEYSVLLVDQLLSLSDAYILGIGESTFPRSVAEFLSGIGDRERASNDFLNTGLYPRSLESIRDDFQYAFDSLLEQNKIRIYQEPERTVSIFIQENESTLTHGNLGASQSVINTFIENIGRMRGNQPVTPQFIQNVLEAVDQLIGGNIRTQTHEGTQSQRTLGSEEGGNIAEQRSISPLISNIQIPERGLTQTAINNLREFRRALEREILRAKRSYPQDAVLSLETILERLSDRNNSTLFIIQSHDPDALRNFASILGDKLLENRRITGATSPLVSFVFDEADEFIRQTYERDSSYAHSTQIAERLARRGRKFGIGIGICTQRTRYLNTSVMAQPHSYLVSKMPRLTDRQAIQEAFGLSEEMFRQTFKFAPGDWLLVSYDATGLKAVPIPIHADDANERIDNFLRERFRDERRSS